MSRLGRMFDRFLQRRISRVAEKTRPASDLYLALDQERAARRAAEAEVERMRPVVRAAWNYTYKPPGNTVLPYAEELRDAVSAYRAEGGTR